VKAKQKRVEGKERVTRVYHVKGRRARENGRENRVSEFEGPHGG